MTKITLNKIHLDTDLGGDLDDMCALAMLLRSIHLDHVVPPQQRRVPIARRDPAARPPAARHIQLATPIRAVRHQLRLAPREGVD